MNVSPIVVLGMHRSGTSCVAGLLAAAGARVPGPAVRNWDNPHGHHEATAAIRLNEAVLAYSGGSWLTAPPTVCWTTAHAAARDTLMQPVGEAPALIKDPRCLLTLPLWTDVPGVRILGVVRHPAAVAASLRSWRGVAAAPAWDLWLAHNRAVVEAGVPVINFDAAGVVSAVATWIGIDPEHIAAAYAPKAVHHRGAEAEATVPTAVQRAALEQYQILVARSLNHGAQADCPPFPWACIARAVAGDASALASALRSGADQGAVLVALTAALTRAGLPAAALCAIESATVSPHLAGLLRAKALLALDRPTLALAALQPALALNTPDWEARSVHPTLLRRSGDGAAARGAQAQLIPDAIHPWQEAATLAVWEREDAIPGHRQRLMQAIDDAPTHRRGRLLCRLARWCRIDGDEPAVTAAIARCRSDDPAWPIPNELTR